MTKGYIPKRTPAAHQVAASQDKIFDGCYFYVEGCSDCCFWRNFVDKDSVKIVACDGWKNVVCSVARNLEKGNQCIGIVDLDFHAYIQDPDKNGPNIFITDDHDLEMMIYHSGDYEKAINQYDPTGKLQQFESDNRIQIYDEAKVIVENIARLRIATKKRNFQLSFRHAKNGSSDFTFPDYKKVLDKNDFTYISNEKLINYIIEWSREKKKNVSSLEEVLPAMNAENVENYDEWKFLNGHDMTQILCILLKGKVRISNIKLCDLERSLYVAYEKENLKNTDLYKKIQDFAHEKGIAIFK